MEISDKVESIEYKGQDVRPVDNKSDGGLVKGIVNRFGSYMRNLAYSGIILFGTAQVAEAVPEWYIQLETELNNHTYADSLFTGIDPDASDGLDFSDLRHPPLSPTGGIMMYTVAEGVELSMDWKANFPNIWEITMLAQDPQFVGYSGTQSVSWDSSSVPEYINMVLNDYGTDPTRTNLVNSVDMRLSSEYVFDVNEALGPYRYIDFEVYEEAGPVTVDVDIRPRMCPNPIYLKSCLPLPVSIQGTEDFDVRDIDLSTIKLEGVSPIRKRYRDITRPDTESEDCECRISCRDGIEDLILTFRIKKLGQVITEEYGELQHGDEIPLNITGKLKDGTPFEGEDCVKIIKPCRRRRRGHHGNDHDD